MNSFQSYHLLKILTTYREGLLPIDAFVSSYFRKNRALGSKDRKHIAHTLFGLIRWKGLIDYLAKGSPTWEKRCHLYQAIDPLTFLKRKNIPIEARLSFPKWMIDHLMPTYGKEEVISFCLASNQKAPITIRINTLKTSRQTLLNKWKNSYSLSPCALSEVGISFHKPLHLTSLSEFKAGLFEIQDEGSQLVADHIHPKKGDHVLDYCAGSGGKTLAFAPKMKGKGQIYLYDCRPHILVEAKKRLKRAGIQNAQILTQLKLKKPSLQKKMDWILLDVPCSGSGTFRRNPGMKWQLSLEDLNILISKQREIFKKALQFLHPKGTIVYATCSVFPEENEHQIAYFTQNHSLIAHRPFFTSLPKEGGMDGFFCALLTYQ